MVVGGGYIGVEVAETLRGTGRDVRLIEAAPSILAPFDPPIRDILHRWMEAAGISVHTGEALQEILPNKNGSSVGGVVTVAGTYPADLVLLALGVRPYTAFLADTGIRRMKNGAIEVDREMRTSLPDVYAAGDCAGVYNRIAEQNVYSALGTVANKCGRIAGENMLGAHVRFDSCLGSSAISVCGMEAARTGLGEAAAGLPFMPVRGLVVSDLLRVNPAFSVVEDPFGSGPVAVVKALRPDVAILHVHRCDSQGNAIIDGPRFEGELLARAAKQVILTTESILPPNSRDICPEKVHIPGFLVTAVVHVPKGAAPGACYGVYEPDSKQLKTFLALKDQAALKEYLASWEQADRKKIGGWAHGRR